MGQLDLYSDYTRDEAISAFLSGERSTQHSNGGLVAVDSAGLLFTNLGRPPAETYLLTNQALILKSEETTVDFYNTIILSFNSRFDRPDGKPLYLLGKSNTESSYAYLGSLRVMQGWTPGRGGPEAPEHVIVRFETDPPLPKSLWGKFDWSSEPVIINGWPLPRLLCKLIVEDRWQAPPKGEAQKYEGTQFANYYKWFSRHGVLLLPDEMERWTDQQHYLLEEGYGDGFYLMAPNQSNEERERLDTSKAVCIGDLSWEEIICFDYSQSYSMPKVRYLASSGWQELAPDFETFADLLRL